MAQATGFVVRHLSPWSFPTAVYCGYSIELDRQAVISACRQSEHHLKAMAGAPPNCKHAPEEKTDTQNDGHVWAYAIGDFGNTQEFNELHGARLAQFSVAGKEIVVFDDPAELLGASITTVEPSKAPYNPEIFRQYLDYVGVKQEIEPRFRVAAY